MRKRSVCALDARGLTVFQHERVNLVCRFFGLVPALGIRRGVALPYRLSKRAISGGHLSGLVSRLKLAKERGRLPRRLSNKRRRHMSVKQTLVGHPTVILTSRPAKGLSGGGDSRVIRLLHETGRRCERAVVVVARGLRVTGATSHIVTVRSKGVVERK